MCSRRTSRTRRCATFASPTWPRRLGVGTWREARLRGATVVTLTRRWGGPRVPPDCGKCCAPRPCPPPRPPRPPALLPALPARTSHAHLPLPPPPPHPLRCHPSPPHLPHPHPHPSRQVPGTVKDVVEGEGPNASVFSVLDVPQPTPANGSYVSDASGLISPTALLYLNRNMSLMERSTPFRVLLVVLPRLPRDAGARRLFGRSLLRHWYGTSRLTPTLALLLPLAPNPSPNPDPSHHPNPNSDSDPDPEQVRDLAGLRAHLAAPHLAGWLRRRHRRRALPAAAARPYRAALFDQSHGDPQRQHPRHPAGELPPRARRRLARR